MSNINLSMDTHSINEQRCFNMLNGIANNKCILIILIVIIICVLVFAIISSILNYRYKIKKLDIEKEFMDKYFANTIRNTNDDKK